MDKNFHISITKQQGFKFSPDFEKRSYQKKSRSIANGI